MDILKQSLLEWNISLTEHQTAQFEKYYELLIQKNQVMNLTAITDKAEVQEKHFLDSLALTQAMPLRGDERLIDIGTGAGFPGVPLKILYPDLQVVLADALLKRVGFLNEVIGELALDGITAVHARAENLGQDPNCRETFELCVSRAVAPLNLLAEYCLPMVRTGGFFVAYKAVTAKEELCEAGHAIEVLGGGTAEIREMIIGPSRLARSLVILPKTGSTPPKYPRAKAGKKPL